MEDLFCQMKAEITALGEDELYNTIEFPLAQVLADMTRTGMLVDRDGIESFGQSLRGELEKVLDRIHQETGSTTFNPSSPKQLGEMLFDTMGLPHGKKTQRGWSTDAETLEALRGYPLVDDVLQYRTYQKLNSTYVEGLLKVIGPDGRIHSTFNQTEARTGRLSSDNPNLQNIPIRTELGSKLRAYFVARPGWVLVDADYSQIELRILAHITGDEQMQQAFLQGEDIHRSTAAKIYGLDPADVTPRLRSSAKAINFGIMYGKGAYSLSKDIGVSVKEADDFLKSYLAAFPKVSDYMDKTIADAKANGYVSTLFGRRRALPGAVQLQLQHSFQRRADGPEHPHPGHRCRCDQTGNGTGMAAAAGRGPAKPSDPDGTRRTDRGGAGGRSCTGCPHPARGDGGLRAVRRSPVHRRPSRQKLAGGPLNHDRIGN